MIAMSAGSFRQWRKHLSIWAGAIILGVILFAAVCAPFVYEQGPIAMDAYSRLQGISSEHWMGTDEFGRDIFSRTCYGIRVSLYIGLSVVLLSSSIGIGLGLLCGYYPAFDRVVSRIIDGFMAFPEIILAITLAAIWGSGTGNIIFALTFAYFPKMVRIVRGSVLAAKETEYLQGGRVAGANTSRLFLRYILPSCLSPIIVQATFCFASAILAEAALSFLGVGIKEPAPSLGSMVSVGRNFMTVAPWMILVPGSAIMLMVLSLNLLGDGLRDWLDPKLR